MAQRMQRLVDWAPELLEQDPPLVAMRNWFERLAGYIRIKRGPGDALTPDDVLLVMGAVWRTPSGPAGQQQADRLLDLIINSFRAGHGGGVTLPSISVQARTRSRVGQKY